MEKQVKIKPALEILLKHLNSGKSIRVINLNAIVDWSVYIEAMEEYANQFKPKKKK